MPKVNANSNKIADRGPRVFVPPPVFYATGLGLGWWLERTWPAPIAGAGAWNELFGALLVVLSVIGVLWAAGRFGKAGTPVVPVKPATALVTDGPFRYSRNPMYVSLTLGYLGVTLLINSLWPLAFLPAVLLAIRFWVIVREEAHLTAVFSEDYMAYCQRVRRWF